MDSRKFIESLFRVHRRELEYFARQKSSEIAEDLVQDSFVRLMQHPEVSSIENHRAYLYRLTNNLLIDNQRKKILRDSYHELIEDFDTLPANQPALDEALHSQRVLEKLLKALDDLSVEQRSIFLLHRYDGMTYQQIGKLIGKSRSHVERQFYLALEHCFCSSLDL